MVRISAGEVRKRFAQFYLESRLPGPSQKPKAIWHNKSLRQSRLPRRRTRQHDAKFLFPDNKLYGDKVDICHGEETVPGLPWLVIVSPFISQI